MTLLYATKNPAKLAMMRELLSSTGIEILGLNDFEPLPDAPEEGGTPLENARQKAQFYYDILKKPLFSCDSGLFFDPPHEALSPGVHVRGWGENRLSDENTIMHYAKIAKKAGGLLSARFRNAVTLITADGIIESDGTELSDPPFGICAVPHEKRIPGLPLGSLSVRLRSGAYYFDSEDDEEDAAENARFDAAWRAFFVNSLGFLLGKGI
jgi:inosine/xanthosine triphosphate pyrophosphatase family protein